MSAACLMRSAYVAQEFTLAALSALYITGLSLTACRCLLSLHLHAPHLRRLERREAACVFTGA